MPETTAAMLPPACEVLVAGAGITGALVADALTEAGMSVVLLDRLDPGTGSTAASTSLLQYEIDVELAQLIELVGEQHAVRSYQLCAAAIGRLEEIIGTLDAACGFSRRPSLYLATRRRDGRRLRKEAELRQRVGLDAEFRSPGSVSDEFGFTSHGALWTGTAAVVDPILLTRALIARAVSRGAVVVPRTTVLSAEPDAKGLRVNTDRGSLHAGRMVYALGYEVPQELGPNLVQLHSTYALVTEPVQDFGRWGGHCLLWETARPYHYLRGTGDGRILIGGADVPFKDEAWRDRLLPDRTKRLERRLAELLPDVRTETGFSWAGTFAQTKDGLPFIGPGRAGPHVCYALGYGGNGITFSVIAADLLRDMFLGRSNPDAQLFRLDR